MKKLGRMYEFGHGINQYKTEYLYLHTKIFQTCPFFIQIYIYICNICYRIFYRPTKMGLGWGGVGWDINVHDTLLLSSLARCHIRHATLLGVGWGGVGY